MRTRTGTWVGLLLLALLVLTPARAQEEEGTDAAAAAAEQPAEDEAPTVVRSGFELREGETFAYTITETAIDDPAKMSDSFRAELKRTEETAWSVAFRVTRVYIGGAVDLDVKLLALSVTGKDAPEANHVGESSTLHVLPDGTVKKLGDGIEDWVSTEKTRSMRSRDTRVLLSMVLVPRPSRDVPAGRQWKTKGEFRQGRVGRESTLWTVMQTFSVESVQEGVATVAVSAEVLGMVGERGRFNTRTEVSGSLQLDARSGLVVSRTQTFAYPTMPLYLSTTQVRAMEVPKGTWSD